MFITVFTPTYNRANLLQQCFNSLLQQTFTNFEWLIVDDGSTDITENVVQNFQKEAAFEINYIKQENSGKHVAINTGINLARGTYFLILDSDDYLPENALQTVCNKIKKAVGVIGVAGRRGDFNNEIIGSDFLNEIICNSLEIRNKYKIKGDLVEVFKTSVLKKFPFPEFENEKFCPEALVWNRIAQEHKLLFFNKIIYHSEYIKGGLTDNIIKIRMQSPKASMLYYSELASYKIPVIQKVKATINFWRFSFNSKKSFFKKWQQVNWVYSIITLPFGMLFYVNDKRSL